MNNYFEYKGYSTRIEFDAESMLLHGKIEGIGDLVTFESSDAGQIETEFHNAVDDYLDFCAEVGKRPEKEYRGMFNVRVNPELHRRLAAEAHRGNVSMNSLVEQALRSYIDIIDRKATPATP